MSAGLLVARTSSRCAVEPGTHRVGSATSWVSPGNSRQAPRRRMSRQLIDRWRRRRGPRRRYSRTTVTPRCMSAISSTKRHPLWPLDVHHRHRLTGRHQTHQLQLTRRRLEVVGQRMSPEVDVLEKYSRKAASGPWFSGAWPHAAMKSRLVRYLT